MARHYGKLVPLTRLTTLAETTRTGSTLAGLADAAAHSGLRTLRVDIDFAKVSSNAPYYLCYNDLVMFFIAVK